MITPDHLNSATDEQDAVATDLRDTTRDADPVPRQDAPAPRLVGDTATGRGDRPIRTRRTANESSYAAAPAVDRPQAADAEPLNDTTQPTVRIEVDDGHVIATVDPVLTDAAADALWRVIEKAMRREEAG